MDKVKFSGAVDTFYFVPNCDAKVAVLYLNVTSKQLFPSGTEEVIIPAERKRFLLQERELGVLAKGKTVVAGDRLEVYEIKDPLGKISYSVKLV